MWMTPEVITVTPQTRASEAAALMTTRRLRRLPVVVDGRVVGVLSRTELLRACPAAINPFSAEVRAGGLLDFEVGTVMSRPVVVVEADAPLEDAVRIMRDRRLGALPVVRNGKLVGVLSQTDVARALSAMIFATGTRRVTAEAPEDPELAEKIAAECGRLQLELRSFVRMEHEGRHLLVLSVRGEPLEPLLERLWVLGCRILHVSR